MCGFGIQLEKRPHRFDRLYEDNPKEWEFWMLRCVEDQKTGEKYGWGRVLDYIGIGWRPEEIGYGQMRLDVMKDGTQAQEGSHEQANGE